MSQTNDSADIASQKLSDLVQSFEAEDGLTRERAREEIVNRGKEATPALIEALGSKEQQVRWEAAKALIGIKDPRAAAALVTALDDSSFEIQWLAAEALIELKQDAIVPLLRGLTKHYESQYVRAGAHHVLHVLEREDLLDEHTLPVLDELRELSPSEPYPIEARKALDFLTQSKLP